MAIVENRSTEIGDVIRIQTEVPIIGVVSLNMFIDDTVGETFGVSGGTSILAFDRGTRAGNRHFYAAQSGAIRYGSINSVDGSFRTTGIGALNTSTGIWDLAYPENTIDGARRINISGTNLYVTHSVLVPRNSPRVGITRLNLTTRTWTTLDNLTFRGSMSVAVEGIYNNRIYFFRNPDVRSPNAIVDAFYDLFEYNITTGNYSEVTTFPLEGIRNHPITGNIENVNRVHAASIDITNGRMYVSYIDQRGTNVLNQLYVYDFTGDTWTTTAFPPEVFSTRTLHWNADDGLIYTLKLNDPRNIFTYNPSNNTWDDTGGTPPVVVSDLTSGNNRVYALAGDGGTYTYNSSTQVWEGTVSNDRFFNKQFRYSLDGGLTFSQFMELSDINIQNIAIRDRDIFVVDIAYERAGSDPSGELTWNSTTIEGAIVGTVTPIYDSTIFKNQFELIDPNVLGWALNVLEKMYQRGLLADYIDRNREGKDDTDFITYWFSVTHLFAILVYWMRLFLNIPANRDFVTQFLGNFDITLPFDLDLKVLGMLYTERLREYRRRGTIQIQTPTADTNTDIDGELLRLIDWNENDFFLFALTEASRFGWCLGLSSPTWTSTAGITNLIMGYETTVGVEDLTAYPLENDTYISIVNDTEVSENVMSIAGYSAATGSVGIVAGLLTTDREDVFPVDHTLDYELSFRVKKLSDDDLDLRVGGAAYDENLNRVNLIPVDGSTSNVNSFQLSPGEETTRLRDIYYRFNVVLHGSGTATTTGIAGNINSYRGLRMPTTTRYIGFSIYVLGGVANRADFYMYDIKIRPRNLPISQGLFGVKNIIVGYLNNNGELNDENARIFIQNKLIPYNSFLIPKWL